MEHGKKKMKMQEGGKTTRRMRGQQNKKRKSMFVEQKPSKRRQEKQEISRKRFQAIFGPKKTTPKKTGPKMSDIMGGARGPKGPLGGPLDPAKAAVKKNKKIDLRKTNLAGERMGQRKAGGKIEKMYGGGMTKKKMMGGGMTVKKMKHGGKAGKCPRDGIAMRGKTRAGRK
jgi:hypothetical protein|tara:strand:+ start:88 stop:600 length:513 start_codon:yes stop_codon:yes gene_type:complete